MGHDFFTGSGIFYLDRARNFYGCGSVAAGNLHLNKQIRFGPGSSGLARRMHEFSHADRSHQQVESTGSSEFNPPEVYLMRSNKHNLTDILALGAMVLAFAVAWGAPFVGNDASAAQAQDQAQPLDQSQISQDQTNQGQAKSATFTGTIVKNGEQYMLRDSSGQVFGLDDSSKAQPFEGKTVKVTGQLDEQAKVIHVENIEGAEA